jgi:hypothetical protein
MFKSKRYFEPILLILTVLFMVMMIACGAFQNMTPAKKYATVRTTYNEIVKQYIAQAKLQPEEIRVKLRTEVNPVIKEAEAALDKYYAALTLPNDNPDARLAFYLDLKTEILNLCLKYGLKITED